MKDVITNYRINELGDTDGIHSIGLELLYLYNNYPEFNRLVTNQIFYGIKFFIEKTICDFLNNNVMGDFEHTFEVDVIHQHAYNIKLIFKEGQQYASSICF